VFVERVCNKYNIPHYKIDHPSPRNRNLNDPKYAAALDAARGFYEGAKKSDIFGKVDFGKDETVEATSSTSESVPF
jgi:hypothetical protein